MYALDYSPAGKCHVQDLRIEARRDAQARLAPRRTSLRATLRSVRRGR